MSEKYYVECDCKNVSISMTGEPRVRGFCHCEDCRDLLKIPYHSVTAWNRDQVEIEAGADSLLEYQHPEKEMKRFFCKRCGETLFNSNAMDWRIVSQNLIAKCYGGELPEALRSQSHFYYGRRIVDIDDDLPKHD